MLASHHTSYRQALTDLLQLYRLTGTYNVAAIGPEHATTWMCTFTLRGVVIGTSAESPTKKLAKEGAAIGALQWLASQGYVLH